MKYCKIREDVFFSLHVPTDFKQSIKLFNIYKDPGPNISYKITVLVSCQLFCLCLFLVNRKQFLLKGRQKFYSILFNFLFFLVLNNLSSPDLSFPLTGVPF